MTFGCEFCLLQKLYIAFFFNKENLTFDNAIYVCMVCNNK